MERSGLPFVNVVVQDNLSYESPEDSASGYSDDDGEENPSKPFFRPVRKYGTQLSRDKDIVAFEERAEEREWEVDDHKIEAVELAKRYDTDLQKGLTELQVFRNRQRYGENFLQPPPKPSTLLKFFYNVIGGLNALLWGCAFLSFASYGAQYLYTDNISLDNLILGCSLIVVIHVSGAFSFYQEFKSNKIMESFKTLVPRSATVYREGQRCFIDVRDIVVGDLVELSYICKIICYLRNSYGKENPTFKLEEDVNPKESSQLNHEANQPQPDLVSRLTRHPSINLPLYEISLNCNETKNGNPSNQQSDNNNETKADKEKSLKCKINDNYGADEDDDENDMKCGIGCFSPKWIQKYATKKSFLIIFSLLGVVQGMTWSYFTATITTLEKRFKISSQTAGIVMTGNEVSQILFSIFISYFGGKGHRPRWISAGVMFSAISCFVLASPQAFYGSGEDALALTEEYGFIYETPSFLQGLGSDKMGSTMNDISSPRI